MKTTITTTVISIIIIIITTTTTTTTTITIKNTKGRNGKLQNYSFENLNHIPLAFLSRECRLRGFNLSLWGE